MNPRGPRILFLILVVFTAPSTRAATPAEVDRAIEKAKTFLYSQQRGGIWDPAKPPAMARPNAQWGGPTAIATYALLAAGESRQAPALKPAIEFLKTADITGMYALGLRAQLWHFLPMTPELRVLVKRDGDLLIASMKKDGAAKGMYNYPVKDGTGGRYDHSISQYGVLGLWSCVQAGYEMQMSDWLTLDHAWREHQEKDGGWEYIYQSARGSTPSMTAAGVATLFITQDYLNMGKGADCLGNIKDPAIDKGLKWMGDNFNSIRGKRSYYTLYGIERIGVAAGYKYFGTIDWYDDGAEALIRSQHADGSWGEARGDVPDTCFAILFLTRGRAPVVMNKLQYNIETAGDKPKLANWNERPRDCAHLTRWMGKQLERDLNWQIVNLNVSVDDLHDAPILYIAGNQPLQFSEAEEKKLKRFVEQGGMILGNADCGSPGFAQTFEKLGTKLFPSYEFRNVPHSHPIFTYPYSHTSWKITPVVRGLTNGARELMLLIPTADYSRLWQLGVYGGREEGHQLLWNTYLYAVDKSQLRVKGQTYIVHKATEVKASKTLAMARLQYSGNWNPEPGGWRRLDNIMHNHAGTDLEIKTVRLGDGKLDPATYKLAHLTGTAKVKWSEAAQSELRTYINAGGTLLIDACGGSSDFATSAEELLAALFPNAQPTIIKPDHPLFNSSAKIKEVVYRSLAKKTLGNLRTPRLKGCEINNRLAIIYSPEDLSVGLVGMAIDGVYGYDPSSATDIARNILVYTAGKR